MAKGKLELIEPDEEIEKLIYDVIGTAIEVHRQLGPGFKECAYENAMCIELGVFLLSDRWGFHFFTKELALVKASLIFW